jgi:hypothetical protein
MTSLIGKLSPPIRTLGQRAVRHVGQMTADARLHPTFLIVGAQRCGSTSLFKALIAHPAVVRPMLHKGVHYFDINYDRSPSWYRGHFPLAAPARLRTQGAPPVTGESSPYYSHHPLAAERIAAHLPEARLIMLIRDPVERAYSAHRHELLRGYETETFEQAVEQEPDRLAGEVDKLHRDPHYRSWSHQHHAYLTRGRYVEQIERMRGVLGADRLLVVDSHDFWNQPDISYRKVLDFLGLPPWNLDHFEQHNARPRSPMPDTVRARLMNGFADSDAALAQVLGWVPSWRR